MRRADIKVLLVEDNPADVLLVQDVLKQVSDALFSVVHVEHISDALQQLKKHPFDIVILGLALPNSVGLNTLTVLHQNFTHIPFLLLSHRTDQALAIQAIKLGAQDYLVKGEVTYDILPRVIRYSIERKKAQTAIKEVRTCFQAIFNEIPKGVALVDSITGAFYEVNPRYAQILGYTCGEMLNLTRLDIIHPDNKQEYRQEMARLSSQQITSFSFTSRSVCADGSLIWTEATATPFMVADRAGCCHLCLLSDVTERKQMVEDLRQLTAHLQSAKEVEGKRIAREIHDELSTNLTVIKMDLDWLSKKIEDKALHERLRLLYQLTATAIDTTKNIVRSLRPSVLDNQGLVGAIEWLLLDFEKRTNIKYKLTTNVADCDYFNDNYQTEIFRIVQESFTNIFKHAKASLVEVSIEETEENITIKIQDNGVGITQRDRQKIDAYGIRGMYERIEKLQGKIEIIGGDSTGSCVILSVPIVFKKSDNSE